jgi:3-keto-5-aminohexanoate cleavage enzyme
MRPVVIAVAITGSVPRKADNPALPVTPAEQIESTHEAFEAGASLVHIHVRNPDESSSSDPELFAWVQDGIRKHCPGMTSNSRRVAAAGTRARAAAPCI